MKKEIKIRMVVMPHADGAWNGRWAELAGDYTRKEALGVLRDCAARGIDATAYRGSDVVYAILAGGVVYSAAGIRRRNRRMIADQSRRMVQRDGDDALYDAD